MKYHLWFFDHIVAGHEALTLLNIQKPIWIVRRRMNSVYAKKSCYYCRTAYTPHFYLLYKKIKPYWVWLSEPKWERRSLKRSLKSFKMYYRLILFKTMPLGQSPVSRAESLSRFYCCDINLLIPSESSGSAEGGWGRPGDETAPQPTSHASGNLCRRSYFWRTLKWREQKGLAGEGMWRLTWMHIYEGSYSRSRQGKENWQEWGLCLFNHLYLCCHGSA